MGAPAEHTEILLHFTQKLSQNLFMRGVLAFVSGTDIHILPYH